MAPDHIRHEVNKSVRPARGDRQHKSRSLTILLCSHEASVKETLAIQPEHPKSLGTSLLLVPIGSVVMLSTHTIHRCSSSSKPQDPRRSESACPAKRKGKLASRPCLHDQLQPRPALLIKTDTISIFLQGDTITMFLFGDTISISCSAQGAIPKNQLYLT